MALYKRLGKLTGWTVPEGGAETRGTALLRPSGGMSTANNIVYRTERIARYFESNRSSWLQFYASERWIFERIASKSGSIGRVLDVGCAAGGLGLALQERFSIDEYVGVEINEQAVAAARARRDRLRPRAEFHCQDIVKMATVPRAPFDLVTNLSCSDWNVETAAITDACWRNVIPGGNLVISLRLTNGGSVNDMSRSYQHICFDEGLRDDDEKANYVVFNVRDALRLFENLRPQPSQVLGYGYWGPPSKSAVTPYDQLVFSVFALTKSTRDDQVPTSELHLPLSLWTA